MLNDGCLCAIHVADADMAARVLAAFYTSPLTYLHSPPFAVIVG